MGIDPGTNYMGYGVLEVCGREVRSVVLGDIDLHRMNDLMKSCATFSSGSVPSWTNTAPARWPRIALLRRERAVDAQAGPGARRGDGCGVEPRTAGIRIRPHTHQTVYHGPRLGPKEQVAALVSSMLTIERPPRRLDATDGMAVALCHHFMSSNPLNGALGEDQFKGLGGGRKAASAKGSSSWERF